MKQITLLICLLIFTAGAYGQQPYGILQQDTAVNSGTQLTLCIDSTKAYSNFVFSAMNPKTGRWTIWWRNNSSGKYEPLYDDNYNRMNVAVAADKREMVYVKYRPQKEGAMYYSQLDTAWVCRSSVDGSNERIVFTVPQFNKNAVYDLDWSSDKKRILYSYGNDEYPSLTRDGDIFEYDMATQTTTNLTNDWQLWSKNCRYTPSGYDFAYSHFANFYNALPTDIFIQRKGSNRQELTNSIHHEKNYQYCTLTDFTGDYIIYRRGLYFDNKLYRKHKDIEELLFATPGYGGVQLGNNLFAATDLYNNIYLFTDKSTIGSIRISGIKTFAKDHAYNFALDCNTRLNWMGRQAVKVRWSTGDTTLSIKVNPKQATTYYCTVTANSIEYTDSVRIKTSGTLPVVSKNCLTLSTTHYKSYQWLLNNTPINGAIDSAYTPEAGGNYAVTVIDKKDRKTTSTPITISNTEADSLGKLNEQIKIIPDPSTSTLQITAPFTINMIVVNEQGKIINKQDNIHEIGMDGLPDGIYNIMLYNNNCLKLKTRRIVKKND